MIKITNNMQGIKKTAIILLIIALLISLYIDYLYFKEKERYEDKYRIFLNHLYFNIDHSLKTVSKILDEETPSSQQDKNFLRLSNSLMQTHLLLSESLFYLDDYHYGITFFQEVNNAIDGFEYNGKKISPFLADKKIDKSERAYLVELKNVLSEMQQKLYSEETGQENPNISKYVFHETIRRADHFTLLKKYIDNLE